MIFQRETSADYDAFRAIQAEIVAIAEQHGLVADKLFEVKLAIEESLIHSLKRFGSHARLSIKAEISASGVKIAIQPAG